MADFIPIPPVGSMSVDTLHEQRLRTLRSTAALENNGSLSATERAKFADAAYGFESMFVHMLMKQMKSGMLNEEGRDNSMTFGAGALEGYTDMQFSEYIAASGGLGLAEMIYARLTGGEKLPNSAGGPSPSVVELRERSSAASTLATQSPQEAEKTATQPVITKAEIKPTTPAAPRGNFYERVQQRLAPYIEDISSAAQKYQLPATLIQGVITAESAGRSDAQSPAGAKGLMQLMDGTAADLGVTDAFDPQQNIHGGARYLRQMLDRFDGDRELALAAYNAGPGAVQKYGDIPPYRETQAYVHNVLRYARIFEELT